MAIDLALNTNLDKVRLNIGDADMDFMTDQTINALLNINNDDVRKATIDCLRAIVAELAKQTRQEVGEVKLWAQDQYKQYKELLHDWQTNIAYIDNMSLHYFGGTSKAASSAVQTNADSRRIKVTQGDFTTSPNGCSTPLDNASFIDCN